MTDLQERMFGGEVSAPTEFQPFAKYFADMDQLIYVNLDCSYRADRVDGWLTLLIHPSEDRLIGIKFKGFRHIFLKLREQMAWKDEMWLPLVRALEVIAKEVGAIITSDPVVREKYAKARRFVETVAVPAAELEEAVA